MKQITEFKLFKNSAKKQNAWFGISSKVNMDAAESTNGGKKLIDLPQPAQVRVTFLGIQSR